MSRLTDSQHQLSDSQQALLRHVVDVAKLNRRGTSGSYIMVPRSETASPHEESLIEQGFLVVTDSVFGAGTLHPTAPGIAALAEADALDLMWKFERAREESSITNAVDQLSTVVFELAKRVAILEANA